MSLLRKGAITRRAPYLKEVLIDSYTNIGIIEAAWMAAQHPSETSDVSARGQSIKPSANYRLTRCKFRLWRNAVAEGTLEARLYAATGTYGVDAKPIGEPLAVSDTVDIATALLIHSWRYIDFIFRAGQQYIMKKDTTYCIEAINKVLTSGATFMSQSLNTPIHGNLSGYENGTWKYSDIKNCHFYVYGVGY